MSDQVITSTKNEWAQRMRALEKAKVRAETGLMLVPGRKLIMEALESGMEPQYLLCAPEKAEHCAPCVRAVSDAGGRVLYAEGRVVAFASGQPGETGAAAVFRRPDIRLALKKGGLYAALDGVQDPGNMGTILRVADALHLDGCLIGPGCADPFSPKTLRGGMGACFRLPLYRGELAQMLGEAKAIGLSVMAADMDGEDFFEREEKGEGGVLLIGSEGSGLSPEMRKIAQATYRLPMPGRAESLNAAVAAGIMLYDLWRGRNRSGEA